VGGGLITPNGHHPNLNAGPQPFSIAAVADRPRTARGKFIPPEKKTGVPTAKPDKPDVKPATKSAKEAAKKRSKSK
jgi:excinuclease ABC subunit A